MQSKPDVRPPVAGHPNPDQRREPGSHFPPVDLKQLEGEVARRLFHEKDGDSLLKDLRQISGTLKMYQQDIDRGLENENPEKFRWRVSPGVAQRLRKEEKQVEAQLQKLLNECKAEAEKIVKEMYPQPAGPTTHIETQDSAPAATSTHQPAAEKETAPKAPVPNAA
jgi:hypothetical protein